MEVTFTLYLRCTLQLSISTLYDFVIGYEKINLKFYIALRVKT